MNSTIRPKQRRRAVLSCYECRRRKQKCGRGHPCIQCVARGPESICTYNEGPSVGGNRALQLSEKPKIDNHHRVADPKECQASGLPSRADDYGYSNSESLNSMEILTKVISGIGDMKISSSVTAHIQSRIRSEYFGYVRRLPSKPQCEILFQYYFSIVNPLNSGISESIFREQLDTWWIVAYNVLLKSGPEALVKDFQCFPALIFQLLAIALQMLPVNHNHLLEELKFGPNQTFAELSKEYSDCGMALFKLAGKSKQSLIGVQHSYIRCCWLTNSGDLSQAWKYSVDTIKDATAIGLHLEPEMPSTSQSDALLDALWMNELRKRTWVNVYVWDSKMALALGRPMSVDLKDCTVTPPIDCEIPFDRLTRVPVARSDTDKPSPMTERLWRYKISLRNHEIRALESEGPIPRNQEKVRELHDFALNLQESLPSFFRSVETDYSWDVECPYIPTHRELLLYSIDAFLMTLHRPYIFTREKSQLQIYKSALAILDSQDRLFENVRRHETPSQYIGVTFPTFDAAVLLAVVLVSNPERYHKTFARPYQSLQNALERLKFIGSVLLLAQTGAEILQTIISRVVDAQERAGFPVPHTDASPNYGERQNQASSSTQSDSPDSWQFKPINVAMEWTTRNPDLPAFDFSNLEVPMPLRELLIDDNMARGVNTDPFGGSFWLPTLDQQDLIPDLNVVLDPFVGEGENSLWDFLTGYPDLNENQWR